MKKSGAAPKRKKPPTTPQKLTVFFPKRPVAPLQDGAAAPVHGGSPAVRSLTFPLLTGGNQQPLGSPSYAPDLSLLPPSESPGKQPNRKKGKKQDTAVLGSPSDSAVFHLPVVPLENFSTTNRSPDADFMKELMLSYHSSVQMAIERSINPVKIQVEQHSVQMQYMELTIEQMGLAFNQLLDCHLDLQKKTGHVISQNAKLSDVQRKSHIKIRGISEEIMMKDLSRYVQDLFKLILPDSTYLDLTFDAIYRIPKPDFLDVSIARDVIVEMHFLHVKDSIMTRVRNPDSLPEGFQHLEFFQDLSWYTRRQRRGYREAVKYLRGKQIPYKWGQSGDIIVGSGLEMRLYHSPETLLSWITSTESPPNELPEVMEESPSDAPHIEGV